MLLLVLLVLEGLVSSRLALRLLGRQTPTGSGQMHYHHAARRYLLVLILLLLLAHARDLVLHHKLGVAIEAAGRQARCLWLQLNRDLRQNKRELVLVLLRAACFARPAQRKISPPRLHLKCSHPLTFFLLALSCANRNTSLHARGLQLLRCSPNSPDRQSMCESRNHARSRGLPAVGCE